MPIHPTAIVDKHSEIDATAEIGAYAIVEPGVRIGAGTRVWPHAHISTGSRIGERCQVHPFATVGDYPQDLGWKNTPSYVEIGDETVIREGATIHRGTPPESTTQVGKRCFLMTCSHIAHNCILADDVKLASGAVLGGWVSVGEKAFISGNVCVHQFTRIGELVIVGGGIRIVTDVAPFMMVGPAGLSGVNVIGLRRAGFSPEERLELRAAFRFLFRKQTSFRDALAKLTTQVRTTPGKRLVEFLQAPSKRGLLHGKRRALKAEELESDSAE